MNSNTMILTRKIQLIINSNDPAFIRETYVKLYRWQRICFRAANTIFTHLFVQEQIKEFLYLTDGTVAKLADSSKSEKWHPKHLPAQQYAKSAIGLI